MSIPLEVPEDIVERTRALCLALPEVTSLLRAGPEEREALLSIGQPFFAPRTGEAHRAARLAHAA